VIGIDEKSCDEEEVKGDISVEYIAELGIIGGNESVYVSEERD